MLLINGADLCTADNSLLLQLQPGTAPHVSTICPPNDTAHDQISQAFPLHICILQAIKHWKGNGLGIRLIPNCDCSLHLSIECLPDVADQSQFGFIADGSMCI